MYLNYSGLNWIIIKYSFNLLILIIWMAKKEVGQEEENKTEKDEVKQIISLINKCDASEDNNRNDKKK